METHENHCVFCKIVAGAIPAHKVFENDDFLAFLDINPRSPGHVQVIPKKHFRFVWDVPNVGEYFEVVRKIAVAQQKAFGNDMISSRINGEEVLHAHIWIFPSQETAGDKKDFAGNTGKIKQELK